MTEPVWILCQTLKSVRGLIFPRDRERQDGGPGPTARRPPPPGQQATTGSCRVRSLVAATEAHGVGGSRGASPRPSPRGPAVPERSPCALLWTQGSVFGDSGGPWPPRPVTKSPLIPAAPSAVGWPPCPVFHETETRDAVFTARLQAVGRVAFIPPDRKTREQAAVDPRRHLSLGRCGGEGWP